MEDEVDVPLIGFYTFLDSVLEPLFEEPERFREILEKEILNCDISLSYSDLTEP